MGGVVLPRQRHHPSERTRRRPLETVPEDPRHAWLHVALLQETPAPRLPGAGDGVRRARHWRQLRGADRGGMGTAYGSRQDLLARLSTSSRPPAITYHE